MTNLAAVVLAAGFGTRLAPLTDTTPKPLLDVAGRPVASHLLDRLRGVDGLDTVVVVVNDRHPEAWRVWADAEQREPTIHLVTNGVASIDDRRGAVADMALGLAALEHVDRWLVLAGDNLLDEALAPHVRFADLVDSPIVLCRDLGADVPPGRFGEVMIDDEGVITAFREKPPEPTSSLVATCTYVLPADAPTLVADYLDDGDPDSPGAFIAWLASRRPVRARILSERYFDIGDADGLRAAREADSTRPRAEPDGST